MGCESWWTGSGHVGLIKERAALNLLLKEDLSKMLMMLNSMF